MRRYQPHTVNKVSSHSTVAAHAPLCNVAVLFPCAIFCPSSYILQDQNPNPECPETLISVELGASKGEAYKGCLFLVMLQSPSSLQVLHEEFLC